MARTRKTLGLSRRGAAIRIEAPGCIVLVRADLTDAEGRPVTSVSVSADGNRYAGDPEQWAHTTHNDTGAQVRVIEGAPRPSLASVAEPSPDDARALAEAERHGAKIARQSDGLFAVLDMDRDSSPLWEAVFRTEAGAARAFLAWVLR